MLEHCTRFLYLVCPARERDISIIMLPMRINIFSLAWLQIAVQVNILSTLSFIQTNKSSTLPLSVVTDSSKLEMLPAQVNTVSQMHTFKSTCTQVSPFPQEPHFT